MRSRESELQAVFNRITAKVPTSRPTVNYSTLRQDMLTPAEHMELGHVTKKWHESGMVSKATMTTSNNGFQELEVTFTPFGIKELILKHLTSPDQDLDVDFLEAQILEYKEELSQLPKGFLEGLRAAEGILRGTDYLENYLDND